MCSKAWKNDHKDGIFEISIFPTKRYRIIYFVTFAYTFQAELHIEETTFVKCNVVQLYYFEWLNISNLSNNIPVI